MSASAPDKLLDVLATLLAPLLLAGAGGDHAAAQALARQAIASLQPDSTTALLQAAQSVGFSLAALAALGQAATGQAATPAMPQAQATRLRAQACRLAQAASAARRAQGPAAAPRFAKPDPPPVPAVQPVLGPPSVAAPQPDRAPQPAPRRGVPADPRAGWAAVMQALANEAGTHPADAAVLRSGATALRQPS